MQLSSSFCDYGGIARTLPVSAEILNIEFDLIIGRKAYHKRIYFGNCIAGPVSQCREVAKLPKPNREKVRST